MVYNQVYPCCIYKLLDYRKNENKKIEISFFLDSKHCKQGQGGQGENSGEHQFTNKINTHLSVYNAISLGADECSQYNKNIAESESQVTD